METTDLRTELAPTRGLTAPGAYTPFGVVSRAFFKLAHDVDARSAAYAVAVAAAALVGTAALTVAGIGLGELWLLVVLGAVAAVAERGTVRLTSTTEQSISLLPMLFAAVLSGPAAAAIVGMASMLGDLRRPYVRSVAYAGSRGLTGLVTGFVATAAAAYGGSGLASIACATVAGAVAAETLDLAFMLSTRRVRGFSNRRVIGSHAPILALSVALYSPVVAVLAFAYAEVSPWTLPLFLIPTLAAQRLFVLYQDQRRLTEDLVSANVRLENANLSFATALVATLDARDQYTAGHSAAVAIYARDIARRMGLSEKTQELAHLCGLVHDIGKIGLAPGLLEKTGPITLDERRQMEQHSVIGQRILAKVEDYAEIARVVRHHHERWDGGGYPDRLAGDEIPLLSRIIAVADAYNAMTSDRPYRDAMPSRVARLRLAQAVESQFDTAVVAAFEALLASATDAYRLGARADFRLEVQEFYAGPVAVTG